ncbi:uncharacterized protein LOC135129117 [Zophobas morio]|uniref:uncharacterized protein LOC135129117 n=1 Tax=Zophobas morio TaxID=2755281 RepID=UPI0030832496
MKLSVVVFYVKGSIMRRHLALVYHKRRHVVSRSGTAGTRFKEWRNSVLELGTSHVRSSSGTEQWVITNPANVVIALPPAQRTTAENFGNDCEDSKLNDIEVPQGIPQVRVACCVARTNLQQVRVTSCVARQRLSEPTHLSDREANLDAAQPVFQEHDDVALDPHVLEMLGETGPSAAAPYQFHSTLSASWERICCQGLDPAKKSTLLKDVVIPSNGEFLSPPKLNPIVRTILSGPNQTRDDSRCAAQAQLSQGLSFLGKSINETITNHNTSTSQVLPLLTQAGQGEFLFGDDLTERKKRTENSLVHPATEKAPPLTQGAVRKCLPRNDQFISPIFLVKKPNGKDRFILNLKQLNTFVATSHLQMEDHRTAARLMQKGCYMSTIDLQDAYFLINVDTEHRKYLRCEHNGQLYEFTCMPFGFYKTHTPYCIPFTLSWHLLRDLPGRFSHLWELGGCLLSKCLCGCPGVNFIGRGKFLGFILDSHTMTISLPLEKRKKTLNMIRDFKSRSRCSIRAFAQFIGTLVPACPAIKYGLMYTKAFEREKFKALRDHHMNYDTSMSLSSTLQNDFLWWESAIQTSHNDIRFDNYDFVIYTDASLTGWGACCDEEKTHGWWTATESQHHINYLELLAIAYALKSFAKYKKSCSILIRTDNTTALSYINRMGSIQYPALSNLARDIWEFCEERNLWFFASYINSGKNTVADSEVRVACCVARTNLQQVRVTSCVPLPEETEYELSDGAFNQITLRFGAPKIDFFASKANHKCRRYVSLLRDAFTIPWTGFFFYAFPPICLILRGLNKIVNDQAEGIMSTTPPVNSAYPGSRTLISQAFSFRNVPEEAINTIIHSVAKSTISQYNSTWKMWWSYCIELKVPIYGTFNSHRSALALTLNYDIGADPLAKRFMKGISQLRPSERKYRFTWDPQIVLDYLGNFFTDNLTLKQLSQKLATLLLLTTGHRTQSIHLIRLSNIKRSSDGIWLEDIITRPKTLNVMVVLINIYLLVMIVTNPFKVMNPYRTDCGGRGESTRVSPLFKPSASSTRKRYYMSSFMISSSQMPSIIMIELHLRIIAVDKTACGKRWMSNKLHWY